MARRFDAGLAPLFVGAFLSLPALAAAPEEKATVGVSVNATILTGFGLSVGTPLGDNFNIRLGGNTFSKSHQFDNDKSTYDGKARLLTYGLLGDWHPFSGAFRLTVGAIDDANKLTLDAKPGSSGTVAFGNCDYTSPDPTDPLRGHGQTNFKSFAPYAGFGWGGNMHASPGFFGTFDIGAMYVGKANITLQAAGKAAPAAGQGPECGIGTIDAGTDPNVQAQVRKDQQDLNDKTDKFQWWPAIGFGIGWRF